MVDPVFINEVDRDLVSNISLLEKIYPKSTQDICAITESGEWLMHGRKVDPSSVIQLYKVVFVYIHSPNDAYDRASLLCKAHAQKYVLLYKATDVIMHHAARLASLIKTYELEAKIPHGIHIDMNKYNADFVSSDVVASKHIRNLFLPVHVMSSLYKNHIPNIHTTLLANTASELSEHIDSLRHTNSDITLRAHIVGQSVYLVSIPKMRGENIYITMPLVSKNIDGMIHFEQANLPSLIKTELHKTANQLAKIVSPKSPAVYTLKVHGKRGVFIDNTSPMYFFVLHNHDFLFALAEMHGVSVNELFESMVF